MKILKNYKSNVKQVFLALILIHSSLSFSQDWQRDTLGLKGNVSYYQHNSTTYYDADERNWMINNNKYFYNSTGFLIRSVSYNNNDSIYYYHSLSRVFNDLGNKCLEEYFIVKGETLNECYFEYDSLGRMTKGVVEKYGSCSTCTYTSSDLGSIRTCFAASFGDKDTSWNIFEYDQQGRLILEEFKTLSYNRVKTWKYNQNNNLIEEKSELIKAPPVTKHIMNGVREVIELDRDPDDVRNYKITYSYNTENHVVHKLHTFLDDRIVFDVYYTYSPQGDAMVEHYLKSVFEEESTHKIDYKYDQNGNWITKIAYKDGELFIEENRVIEYFGKK